MDKLTGIAISCDENGVIDKIIRDDYGIIQQKVKPKLIATLFKNSDVAKVLNFILQVRENGMVFDMPLSLQIKGKAKTLSLTGFHIDSKLLIIGVDSPSESLKFINQLQQINNEQANKIRKLLKNKYVSKPKENSESTIFLDEFSSLNNELVNLQRELAKKNAELERVNNLKNEFLGMAAHDIRNPLGIILSYADFLKEQTKGQISEKHQNFLRTISTSAEFLMNLIEDLLDITHIESGKLTLKLSKTNIVDLVRRNIELNNTLASSKNISINLTSYQNNIEINIDAQKIEQVLNNLLTNAVKFSYPNTTVQVAIAQKEKSVLVEVVDLGIGIEEDFLNNIFIPFSPLNSEGTGGEKCTGLGLSIVKKIVEGHNGMINVESIPGKGSRFYFEIPIA